MATTAGNEALRQQFLALQEQQQQKLQRRKQLKKEKDKQKAPASPPSLAFGVSDNLDLKLADPPPKSDAVYSEELTQHLNEQIRELKDESGRLYKLLSERDLELRQLRKKNKSGEAGLTSGQMASEAAATKIVDLSKKVREITAELEAERTKSKQAQRQCRDLQIELQKVTSGESKAPQKKYLVEDEDSKEALQHELKVTQEKLKQADSKSADLRNQCAALKQELKVAHKVLESEVGDNVNIQSLLNSSSNWKGRQQQVITLQKKVSELKAQLGQSQMGSVLSLRVDHDLESELMGSSRTRRSGVEERHHEQIRKLEKERREAQEKAASELEALEKDHAALKSKVEASKARNKVLSGELKTLKQQLQTLLEKGKHDDELIQALMKQQAQMKKMMDDVSKTQQVQKEQEVEDSKKKNLRTQQEGNVVEQLKVIVAEKEAKVKALEQEIKDMQLASLQKAQMNSVQALFTQVSDRPPTAQHSSRPSSSRTPIVEVLDEVESINHTPLSSARNSARSLSRQSMLSDISGRPFSSRSAGQPSARSENKELDELRTQYQEFKSLYHAATVERDKLAELTQVLQQRLDESTQQLTDTNRELQSQKHKNVSLEKQLGKSKVELGPKSGRKTKSKAASTTSLRDTVDLEGDDPFEGMTSEELQTNLAIQRDENEALKAALQSTLRAKEEDLKLYQQMMAETKAVFLQGLRQFRGQAS